MLFIRMHKKEPTITVVTLPTRHIGGKNLKCDLSDRKEVLIVVIVNVTDKCNNNHHNRLG